MADGPKAILEEIERRRAQASEERQFFTPPPESKFSKDSSKPLIVWQAWNPTVTPGESLVYTVGIANPTPKKQLWLFGHVFVGRESITTGSPGQQLLATGGGDPRFPSLTQPRFPGLTLEAEQIASLSFVIPIPSAVERSNYLGNCLVFQATWHDFGVAFDRGQFVFEVS